MRLFHFSDDPDISEFVPRPVLIPSQRPAGREWLNGPLVWAIEEEFDFVGSEVSVSHWEKPP